MLGKLSLKRYAGNFKTIRMAIERLGLDVSHFVGRSRGKGNKGGSTGRPLSEILVAASSYSNSARLKLRLIREGLLKEVCVECGQVPFWNGKSLVLVLDHISGVNNDHRLENLRLLCPNCNSQTETFAGRNSRNKVHLCQGCGKDLKKMRPSGLCVDCYVNR